MSFSIPAPSFSLCLPRSCSPRFFKYQSRPSSAASLSCFRVACRSGSQYTATADFKFALHDALDSIGIDTSHAREARQGFISQIENLSAIERATSISINRRVDLGRTALYIAAEDDSLISHSSVPLPVEAFLEKLDDLSTGYFSQYNSSCQASRENFLESIERYLYIKKGFRRNSTKNQLEPQALYLPSVLAHRSGSAVMLSLIYSEILKMLRLCKLLDFDVEIFFPHDLHSLPRAYDKQKSKESDQLHIMTTQMLLDEILKNQKDAFWPFQQDHTESLFLRAALAANLIDGLTGVESGYQLASAKFAQHWLGQSAWTNVHYGNMRLALSACERLILLKVDPKELRDYSILLYHCGFYEQSLQYLKLYQESKSSLQNRSLNSVSSLEEDVAQKLMVRLNLIAPEDGWSKPSHASNFLGTNSEQW
ncbi:hypothetical protein SLE2022_066120 [Rubroshorea leprosula]